MLFMEVDMDTLDPEFIVPDELDAGSDPIPVNDVIPDADSGKSIEIPDTSEDIPALVTEIATDWISLKDYAKELGISYEAVRQQVNKKQAELEGHIKNIGKTRFLDAEARVILNTKKTNAPRSFRQLQQSSSAPLPAEEHRISVVDIRHDMIDDRWTIDDYRARIRLLEDEKRDLENEYEMLKSLLASMNMAEFRSWKKQQKKEWNDRFIQRNDY